MPAWLVLHPRDYDLARDFEAMRRSMETLRALQQTGARLWFGHDAEQWGTLCPAPAEGR